MATRQLGHYQTEPGAEGLVRIEPSAVRPARQQGQLKKVVPVGENDHLGPVFWRRVPFMPAF